MTRIQAYLCAVALGASTAAGSVAVASTTCPALSMVWHDPATGAVLRSDPYVCGADLCGGYRCKTGDEISPACYSAEQCTAACGGACVYIPTSGLDCEATCSTGSGGGVEECTVLMTWYKRKTLVRAESYDCETDACTGFRCLDGGAISPACYSAAQCDRYCDATCVDVGALAAGGDCGAALCSLE